MINKENLELMEKDLELKKTCTKLLETIGRYKYPYNFEWLGVPIIQCPQDIVAVQEIIWDTKPDIIIEDMPVDYFPDRPWGVKNNPKTAVHEFFKDIDCFKIQASISIKFLITAAQDGYLKCIK